MIYDQLLNPFDLCERLVKSMLFKIGKWIAIGYGLLLTLAAGGFVCANIFGLIAGVFLAAGEPKGDAAVMQTWMHRGWYVGVALALLGAISQRARNVRKRKSQSGEPSQNQPKQASRNGRRLGFVASTLWGGLGGALLGGMFGATLILLWFSLTYSPFAPQGWVESVSVERQRTDRAGHEERVLTTDHPVVMYAFGVPLACGAFTGAMLGGVFRVTEG